MDCTGLWFQGQDQQEIIDINDPEDDEDDKPYEDDDYQDNDIDDGDDDNLGDPEPTLLVPPD